MKGSEPAYPYPGLINPHDGTVLDWGAPGMPIRLHIATQLMASRMEALVLTTDGDYGYFQKARALAIASVKAADALLEAESGDE